MSSDLADRALVVPGIYWYWYWHCHLLSPSSYWYWHGQQLQGRFRPCVSLEAGCEISPV